MPRSDRSPSGALADLLVPVFYFYFYFSCRQALFVLPIPQGAMRNRPTSSSREVGMMPVLSSRIFSHIPGEEIPPIAYVAGALTDSQSQFQHPEKPIRGEGP